MMELNHTAPGLSVLVIVICLLGLFMSIKMGNPRLGLLFTCVGSFLFFSMQFLFLP